MHDNGEREPLSSGPRHVTHQLAFFMFVITCVVLNWLSLLHPASFLGHMYVLCLVALAALSFPELSLHPFLLVLGVVAKHFADYLLARLHAYLSRALFDSLPLCLLLLTAPILSPFLHKIIC